MMANNLNFAAQCLYNAVAEKVADAWSISYSASDLDSVCRSVMAMADTQDFAMHQWKDDEISGVIFSICEKHGVQFDADAVKSLLQAARDEKAQYIVVAEDKQGRPHIDEVALADYIMHTWRFLLVRPDLSHDPDIYVYDADRGIYEQYCPSMIQGLAVAAMERIGRPGIIKSKEAREVAAQILMRTKNMIRYNALNSNENIIVFLNGVLELDDMTFRKHSPEDYGTVCLNTEWALEDGDTPVFDKYLDDLCCGDDARKKLLLQYLGAVCSMTKGSRFKKSLLLVGDGDSGKSQLIKLACLLIGVDNIQAISLKDLSSRFAVGSLAGKRLGFSGDMEYGKASDMSEFKRITGGDITKSERKGKDAVNTEFRGFFWFAANELPKFGGDNGKWVYDRFIVLKCENPIPEEKRDRRLLDKMMKEAPYIMRKAIYAFRECLDSYKFSEPETVAEAREEYRAENDPIYRFMKELMIAIPENGTVIMPKGVRLDRMTISDIYKVYCGWYRKEFDNAYAGGLADFKKGIASYAGCKESELLRRASSGMVLKNYLPNWQRWVDEEISDIVEYSCVQVSVCYTNPETGENHIHVTGPDLNGAHIVRSYGN
jgi:P4 family phage/plasmid primase-like protien